MDEVTARSKRVNRLKKIILYGVAMAILIPIIISVILSIRIHFLKKDMAQMTAKFEAVSEKYYQDVDTSYESGQVEESQKSAIENILEGQQEDQSKDEKEKVKQVYLTFDDGPSTYTDQILDILKAYDVKATFFVVGKQDEKSKAAYQRIVKEGHTLGMHSYTHQYDEIYASKQSYLEDLITLQEYLYEETGVWSRFLRFPGGSSNQVSKVDMQTLIDWTKEQNLKYFDWNVASGDAVKDPLSKETIVKNCLDGIKKNQTSIVLLHDATEKKSTVDALPELITALRLNSNVEFLAINDDTPLIQHK